MDIKQIEREFAEKIEKALRNNDYRRVDNLMRQFDRIKNTRECVPAKKITDVIDSELFFNKLHSTLQELKRKRNDALRFRPELTKRGPIDTKENNQ